LTDAEVRHSVATAVVI